MSRARDRLGRPVDENSSEVVPGVIEREQIDAESAWSEAMGFLERDMPFHAHEIFEMRWRCCPDSERDLWRALARWAAALTHLERGNAIGASSIARATMTDLAQAEPAPVGREEIDGVLASLAMISHVQ